MLELLPNAQAPNTYVELPFVWPESPAQARNASKDLPPSPIVELVTKKPWLLANLYSGRIPNEASAEGKGAIQVAYQALFQKVTAKIALTPYKTELADEWAFETGSASGTFTPKTGKPVASIRKGRAVLQRLGGSGKNPEVRAT